MANESTIELAALRFEGRRFEGHALDVECTHELIAYRSLILECAKELWRRKNPDRARLPKGFEDGCRVQFDRIDEGSAVVPLRRVREAVQPELDLGDEFDEAAALVDAVIAAAARNESLRDRFPANLTCSLGRAARRSRRPARRRRARDFGLLALSTIQPFRSGSSWPGSGQRRPLAPGKVCLSTCRSVSIKLSMVMEAAGCENGLCCLRHHCAHQTLSSCALLSRSGASSAASCLATE